MALATNLTLTTLFGASAAWSGSGSSSTVSFRPGETGTGGNVTTPGSLHTEGVILALLQKWYDAQGSDAARHMEVIRNLPVSAYRGGDEVRGESFTIRIFSDTPVTPVDPDAV